MAADYPGATWVAADPSNYRSASRQRVSIIVIHCTDGHENAQPVAEMWQGPQHGSSAHFVIGQDGTVLQCVRIKDVAWHAHSANSWSVGIEHCARTPGELSKPGYADPGLPPSDAQYAASAQLVAWLCAQEGLQPSRVCVVGHNEADSVTTHRQCPTGCGWDWPRYMTLVVAEFAKLAPAV